MFDNFDISIDENEELIFSKKILNFDEGYENYLKYKNKKLTIDSNCKQNLSVHYKKFVEKNNQ